MPQKSVKENFFDVCVLGNSIGGFIAALVLQTKGARTVMVMDHNAERFDPLYCEFLNAFSLKPVLKRIGFHPSEVNSIPSLDAPVQVIMSNSHRLDCFGDEKRFERELNREFSSCSKQILQLFRDEAWHLELYQYLLDSRISWPPVGFWEKRAFQKVIKTVCEDRLLQYRSIASEMKRFEVGEEFLRIIKALQLCLTGSVSSVITSAQLAHLLTIIRWEGHYTVEGVASIKTMIKEKIEERGGKFIVCDAIKEPLFHRGRIQGFKLLGSPLEEIACACTIVGGDPMGLIRFDPGKGVFRKWGKQCNALPIFAKKAFQIYRLSSLGIPVGMRSQGIFVSPLRDEGQEERRKFIRALRYVIHPISQPTTDKNLAITAYLGDYGQMPSIEQIDQEIRELIKCIIPFVDHHLVEKPKKPEIPSLDNRPGDFRQSVVYGLEQHPIHGIFSVSPRTPIKNVFLVSDQVFPGLGLDGEIITGLQVAGLIEKSLSISKP